MRILIRAVIGAGYLTGLWLCAATAMTAIRDVDLHLLTVVISYGIILAWGATVAARWQD